MSQKEGRRVGYNCGEPDRANGSNKSSNKVTAAHTHTHIQVVRNNIAHVYYRLKKRTELLI